MGFFSWAFLVFLMKETKKIRQKQRGKFMAKSCSQPVILLGTLRLMNPLLHDRKMEHFEALTQVGHASAVVNNSNFKPEVTDLVGNRFCPLFVKTLQGLSRSWKT